MKLKVISLFLVIILLLNIIIPSIVVLATDIDNLSIKGTYQYTSNENYNKQLEDSFEYRDECFMRSSFLGCEHLETLSSQVAISSASWYGENEDKYEVDYSNNSHNVVDFLRKMEFKDVSTNKYYTLEKEENSGAVAVGHKEIKTYGKTYTLLAVIPRSAGYKQEWVGNFDVGTNGIHKGFKAARDEILRYVKKYIQDNNIEGNLKIWTVGHSRGAAVSNMLGAFFAGGGIEYFGNSVSLIPEDVYCYTYATPTTIIAGTDKNIELSVAGYRGGENYSNDTIGDAYSYTKGGKVDPQDEVYGGIRNFISPYDFITKLPLEVWGYTHYGTDISINHDGKVSENAMLDELKDVSPYTYNKYVNKSGVGLFEGKTIDINSLKIIKDNGNNIKLQDFVRDRINGLAYKANTIEKYNNGGYQEGLKAAAGIYGMALVFMNDTDIDVNEIKKDEANLIYSALFTYLAYASERLQEEGRAGNDIDASKIAIEELLSYVLDEEINDNTIIDEVIENLFKRACENENRALLDKLISLNIEATPEDARELSKYMLSQYYKDYNSETTSEEELWETFIKACVYGTDENAPTDSDAKNSRKSYYQMVTIKLMNIMPNEGYDLAKAIFTNDFTGEENISDDFTGEAKISDVIDKIYPLLMKVKDEEGNTIKIFRNFAEAADYRLAIMLDKVFNKIITDCGEKYGNSYQTDLRRHVENAKENITKIREAFIYFFLYDNEGFNAKRIIGDIVTFISNAECMTLPHYNEIYIAYAKAAQKIDCGYGDHLASKYIIIEGDNQTYTTETNNDLVIKANGEFSKFTGLKMDGIDINESNYTATNGSTIVTLKRSYLDTLNKGNHILSIIYTDGTANASILKAKNDEAPGTKTDNNSDVKSNKTSNPKTGDTIIIWINLLAVSILGIVGTVKLYCIKNK